MDESLKEYEMEEEKKRENEREEQDDMAEIL